MKRILSSILVVAVLALAGAPAVAPTLSRSVAFAEPSDQDLMGQLAKVKKMVGDIDKMMKPGKMKMDAAGRDSMMKMLTELERIAKEIEQRLRDVQS